MGDKVRTAGVEEARTKLPSLLRAANRDGDVTVVTKRGVPYAAIVPMSKALAVGPTFGALRGSANGCYGNAVEYIDRLRDEW